MSESAAEVIAEHSRRVDFNHPAYGLCRCGLDPDDLPGEMTHGEHVVDALREAGWGVVSLPELQADYREHTALAEAAHARDDIAEANYQYGRSDTLTKIFRGLAAAAVSQDGEK